VGFGCAHMQSPANKTPQAEACSTGFATPSVFAYSTLK
jgi:hypothetical protein